jgi:hypothetical protein
VSSVWRTALIVLLMATTIIAVGLGIPQNSSPNQLAPTDQATLRIIVIVVIEKVGAPPCALNIWLA